MVKKILVINGGSSSFKYQVLEKETERRLCQGQIFTKIMEQLDKEE